LKLIALNRENVTFTKMDLTYLIKDKYDKQFAEQVSCVYNFVFEIILQVYAVPSITQAELHAGKLESGVPLPPAIRLTYEEKNTYKNTAKAFSLMDDFRVCFVLH
jgi:alpha-1,3-mannosyl-glycoprotein beta-1,2-N-acetylglucosaminyltransferase